MFARSAPLGLVLACALAPQGQGAGLADYLPALRKATACMIEVLRSVPGVTDPTSGVLRADPRRGATRPTPFVRYTWQGRGPVTFTAAVTFLDRGQVVFLTALSGLSEAGKEPDDWGTDAIVKRWIDRCGVTAGAIYD